MIPPALITQVFNSFEGEQFDSEIFARRLEELLRQHDIVIFPNYHARHTAVSLAKGDIEYARAILSFLREG